MRSHVAFIVESAHGHINPILGITSELVSRGYRVTCAVREYFASRVVEAGGEAVVYSPVDYRARLIPKMREFGQVHVSAMKELWKQFEQEEVAASLPQLQSLYQGDRPDLIVYDLRNLAGKVLASEWGISKIEHAPMLIESNEANCFGRPYDENLVLVSVPRFFQPNAKDLDDRFHFLGPIYNGRGGFKPWKFRASREPKILVSATTAVPQPEFYQMAIAAFENLAFRVILSIGNEIDPGSLGPLPTHFEINKVSSQLEILEHASLFIGQGGVGSTLEALYCGVPVLLIPPNLDYDRVPLRIAELGLGVRLEGSVASIEQLRNSTVFLLEDGETRKRAMEVRKAMRETNGAQIAGDLVDAYITRENQ